nr:MAG: hypothetical protein J07AB56_03470 [Candidatus Nanosalinarum sp. J07AB56]
MAPVATIDTTMIAAKKIALNWVGVFIVLKIVAKQRCRKNS